MKKFLFAASFMFFASTYINYVNAKQERCAYTVMIMPDGSRFVVEGELSDEEIRGYYDFWEKYNYPNA